MTHLIELALTLLAAYGSNGRTADTMGRTRRASIKASLCELDRGTQASASRRAMASSAINDAGRPRNA